MNEKRTTDLKKRGEFYHDIISHINKAIDAGYYLEVITLLESLICDRLESRNSYLLGKPFSFHTLGDNFHQNQKIETDEKLLELTKENGEVAQWAKLRNESLHAMAKIAKGDGISFHEKYEKLKNVIDKGEILFRKIDKEITRLRKKKN